jgi:hypothetical protein
MNLDFKRLLETETGRIIVSIILGLGLATLFRKICTDGDCIDFHGVVIGDFNNRIFRHDEKCYRYVPNAAKCNEEIKRIVDVHDAASISEGLNNQKTVKNAFMKTD